LLQNITTKLTSLLIAATLGCAVFVWLTWPSVLLFLSNNPNEIYGFIDKTGVLKVNLRTQKFSNSPDQFYDGLSVVGKLEGTEGKNLSEPIFNYLTTDGKLLMPDFAYSAAQNFSEALAAVKITKATNRYRQVNQTDQNNAVPNETCWCFINTLGQRAFTTEEVYSDIKPFAEGLAAVKSAKDNQWHFINKAGKTAIASTYEDASPFCEKRASIKRNGKWGLIDESGKTILEPTYEAQIESFHEGLAAVREADRVIFLDKHGVTQLTLRIKHINKRYLKFLAQGKNHTFLRITDEHSNNAFFDCQLGESKFSNGLAVFQKNNLFGYCDRLGNTKIKAAFDYCWPFSDGRALVYKETAYGGRFAFIDTLGNLITDLKFQKAYPFSEGLALVAEDNGTKSYRYIDRSGKYVFGANTYSEAGSFHNGFARVGSDFKCRSF
jgi:hypothetical protein